MIQHCVIIAFAVRITAILCSLPVVCHASSDFMRLPFACACVRRVSCAVEHWLACHALPYAWICSGTGTSTCTRVRLNRLHNSPPWLHAKREVACCWRQACQPPRPHSWVEVELPAGTPGHLHSCEVGHKVVRGPTHGVHVVFEAHSTSHPRNTRPNRCQ